MTWKDVSGFIATAAPTVGSLLGGSVGGKVGEFVSSILGVPNDPDKVMEALKNNPEAMVKIKEIEANRQIELARIALGETGEETKQVQAVNETMRAESASTDRWASRWRPFWGFASAVAFCVTVLFVCVLAYKAVIQGNEAAMDMIPAFITNMAILFGIPGSILGVASWHRGMMQRVEAGERK